MPIERLSNRTRETTMKDLCWPERYIGRFFVAAALWLVGSACGATLVWAITPPFPGEPFLRAFWNVIPSGVIFATLVAYFVKPGTRMRKGSRFRD
jgi:hypothetical protein